MDQKEKNDALDALLKMRAESDKDSIKYAVLSDALEHEDAQPDSTGEAISYLEDVCNHGCVSGTVSQLIYYADTKKFFIEHIDEIDEMRSEMEDECGEPLKIGTPLYNWLAWFAYEETARKILQEVAPDLV